MKITAIYIFGGMGNSNLCTLQRKQQREPIGTSFIIFSVHIIINIIQPSIRYLLLLAHAAAYVVKCTDWSFPFLLLFQYCYIWKTSYFTHGKGIRNDVKEFLTCSSGKLIKERVERNRTIKKVHQCQIEKKDFNQNISPI